jgi:TorA maturation chaperone TorD
MDKLGTELRILASLLGAPDLDAKEAVEELAVHYLWLQPAAKELEHLSMEEWQAEHTRLFVKGATSTLCPPFESAYLHSLTPGSQQQSLQDLYQRMGMAPMGAPADYLGTMLECAANIQSDPQVGKAFWDELWVGHLRNWVPRFCRELQTESRMVMYRIVGRRLCELFPEVRLAMSAVA